MKLIARVTAIFNGTIGLLTILAGILLIFIMLGISADVVTRYALNRSILGAGEVAEYSLLFIIFLAAAWVLRKEGHVRIELLLTRLKPETQTVLNIITSIMGAIICFVLTWYGVKVTWDSFQAGAIFLTVLEPPKFAILFVIPLGSFLLFIQFLRRANGYRRGWRASSDKLQRS